MKSQDEIVDKIGELIVKSFPENEYSEGFKHGYIQGLRWVID